MLIPAAIEYGPAHVLLCFDWPGLFPLSHLSDQKHKTIKPDPAFLFTSPLVREQAAI